jgi:hypothetical protein
MLLMSESTINSDCGLPVVAGYMYQSENLLSACLQCQLNKTLAQWSERQVSQLQCTGHINIVFTGVNTVATVGDIRLQRLQQI